MRGAPRRLVCVYAVVPAGEADGACRPTRGLGCVAHATVAALVGGPAGESASAALRHDCVIGRAVEACSSVVPFRLGVELESRALGEFLATNLQTLVSRLARFRGRLEMGLKVKLVERSPGALLSMPLGLECFHALTPQEEDRREGLRQTPAGPVFEGCYLVSRQDVEPFWAAVETLRAVLTDVPVLGTGPWAPYSFCDFALRPVSRHAEAALPAQ